MPWRYFRTWLYGNNDMTCSLCGHDHSRWSDYCSAACQRKGIRLARLGLDQPRTHCLLCGNRLPPGHRVDLTYCSANCRKAAARNTWDRPDLVAAVKRRR